MARIAITGGAGFIGSHLTDLLLSKGNEVIVVDNFFTGRKKNIEKHFSNPNFEFIRHDILNPLYLEVDKIYHLACPASPVHYQYNPIKTIKTNIIGTMNMLGLAKRTKARFFLASTSEVYGNPLEHPQKETYWGNVNTIGPRSCYDEGKRAAETLTMDYHNQNNVDIRIVRIFNTYGPRMLFNDGRVVSNFIVQALTGENITIYGDGTQTRSFCFVSDLIQGFEKLMNCENFTGPCNLGNPCEMSMNELASLIIKLTNSSSKIIYKPLPKDDPLKRKPDISLAKEKLGWEPKVNVEDGLLKTIENFDERLKQGEKKSETFLYL